VNDDHLYRVHDAALAEARRSPGGRGSREEWFADEVAIDFPSVGAVVERIREAFFGLDEANAPLSAEVLLTPREAFDGVRIPLDVPVRSTCGACGGRGEVWMEPCGPCAGRGIALRRHHVQLLVPPRVRHGARFRFSVTPPSSPATHVEVRITIQ
jgi:hypothetical protein